VSVDSLASLSAWRPLPSEEERTSRAVPGRHPIGSAHAIDTAGIWPPSIIAEHPFRFERRGFSNDDLRS